MNKLVTKHQALILKGLGFDEPTVEYYVPCGEKAVSMYHSIRAYEDHNKYITEISAPTVDEAIDWIRKNYHIMIYNAVPPFVDPTAIKNPYILYRYAVKYCNLRDGWNGRESIGSSNLTKNIYAAKRQGITLALRWIKKNPKHF